MDLDIHSTYPHERFQIPVASNITKEDEAAAMAAMFQAQTQNWEETQEKMSQLVDPLGFICCIVDFFINEHCLFLLCLRAFQCPGDSSQPTRYRFWRPRWKVASANQRQTFAI